MHLIFYTCDGAFDPFWPTMEVNNHREITERCAGYGISVHVNLELSLNFSIEDLKNITGGAIMTAWKKYSSVCKGFSWVSKFVKSISSFAIAGSLVISPLAREDQNLCL